MGPGLDGKNGPYLLRMDIIHKDRMLDSFTHPFTLLRRKIKGGLNYYIRRLLLDKIRLEWHGLRDIGKKMGRFRGKRTQSHYLVHYC